MGISCEVAFNRVEMSIALFSIKIGSIIFNIYISMNFTLVAAPLKLTF